MPWSIVDRCPSLFQMFEIKSSQICPYVLAYRQRNLRRKLAESGFLYLMAFAYQCSADLHYLSHLCIADVILQLALMLYCINDLQFSCLGISTLLHELKHADGITYQLQSISIASHYSVRY